VPWNTMDDMSHLHTIEIVSDHFTSIRAH